MSAQLTKAGATVEAQSEFSALREAKSLVQGFCLHISQTFVWRCQGNLY